MKKLKSKVVMLGDKHIAMLKELAESNKQENPKAKPSFEVRKAIDLAHFHLTAKRKLETSKGVSQS